MSKTRVPPHTDLNIDELEAAYLKSTRVVAWYAHPGEVLGPFCRWLTVSEINPEYQKHCGSKSDDAAYAAMAMNAVPHLIAALREQANQVASLSAKVEGWKKETDFYAEKLEQLQRPKSGSGEGEVR